MFEKILLMLWDDFEEQILFNADLPKSTNAAEIFSAMDTYFNSVSSPGQSVLVWQRMGQPRWQENIQGSNLLFEHASPFLIKKLSM